MRTIMPNGKGQSHKCENVLNPSYHPTTREETLLFMEQNGFMYDVFVSNIKTNMAVHFVRVHEDRRNAQGVWADYKTYMVTSSKAELQVTKLLAQLTSQKLEASSRTATQEFIIAWQEKVREFESLTPLGINTASVFAQ